MKDEARGRGQDKGVMKALRQWESDTEARASVVEANAFIDGYEAGECDGRESAERAASPSATAPKPTIHDLEKLIVHCYIHDGYANCGYGQMTTLQKRLYRDIADRSEQILEAASAQTRSEGDAPSCHVCGSDMDFRCLKCGTVTGCAPAEASEGTMNCPACGSRERDPRHALATDSTNLYLCEHPWHSVIAVKAIKEWKAAESELTRLREAHRWIPVEEKLPPENNEYLVCEPDVGTTTADFRDGEWFTVRSFGQDCEERPLYAVTHWQPLPEPPTGAAQPDAQEKGK